jgi:DNA repair photolyase
MPPEFDPAHPSGKRDAEIRHVGRGAQSRPANRFERVAREVDGEWLDDEGAGAETKIATQYLPDDSQSLVTQNDSPDIGFRYSANPYRGCAHGCSYCYARPTHEYLGFDAGLDFESRILVKHRAPELFREWLMRPAWVPETIMFSGVTDCYQPIEREYRLTRQCLEVAWESRQPISIVTKNALIRRDLDLLTPMAQHQLIHVAISVTTLRQDLSRTMEPRTSSPAARLEAMRALSDAGVPTQVMVAPVIPGLNDHEIPRILEAAQQHGAQQAGYTLLRLPQTVLPVFQQWLQQTLPLQAERITQRVMSVRSGKMNDSQFGQRMRGTGPLADQIAATFQVFRQRYGLSEPMPTLNTTNFRSPRPLSGQLRLF